MVLQSPPLLVLGPESKLLLTFAAAGSRPKAGRPAKATAHTKPVEEERSERLVVSRGF